MRRKAGTDRPQKSRSGARARPEQPPETDTPDGSAAIEVRRVSSEERLRRIVQLMTSFEWRTSMIEELAAAWNVSVHTVRDDSIEAGRYLKVVQDPEQLRATAIAELVRIAHESGPDRVQALRVALEASGQLRTKVEVSGQFGSVPTTELARELLKLRWFQELLQAEGWAPPGSLVETTGEEA